MKKLKTGATIIDTRYIVTEDTTKCVIRFKNPYTNCINKVTGTTKRNPNDINDDVLAQRICEGRTKLLMFIRLYKDATAYIDYIYDKRRILSKNICKEKEHLNGLLNPNSIINP